MRVHQLVAEAFLNHKRDGYNNCINHVDFDRTNNNLNNLEISTFRVNGNKKHLKSGSKYTGVSYKRKTNNWLSQIHYNGKTRNIGTFKTELEASNAYQQRLKEIN